MASRPKMKKLDRTLPGEGEKVKVKGNDAPSFSPLPAAAEKPVSLPVSIPQAKPVSKVEEKAPQEQREKGRVAKAQVTKVEEKPTPQPGVKKSFVFEQTLSQELADFIHFQKSKTGSRQKLSEVRFVQAVLRRALKDEKFTDAVVQDLLQ